MKIKRKQQADFRTEKYTRFGIRKYSFGVASVAIATGLMFLGSGAVSANELTSQGAGDQAIIEKNESDSLNEKQKSESTYEAPAVIPAMDSKESQSSENSKETQPMPSESTTNPVVDGAVVDSFEKVENQLDKANLEDRSASTDTAASLKRTRRDLDSSAVVKEGGVSITPPKENTSGDSSHPNGYNSSTKYHDGSDGWYTFVQLDQQGRHPQFSYVNSFDGYVVISSKSDRTPNGYTTDGTVKLEFYNRNNELQQEIIMDKNTNSSEFVYKYKKRDQKILINRNADSISIGDMPFTAKTSKQAANFNILYNGPEISTKQGQGIFYADGWLIPTNNSVTVRFKDKDTNKELVPSYTLNGLTGMRFDTTAAELKGYELVDKEIVGSPNGYISPWKQVGDSFTKITQPNLEIKYTLLNMDGTMKAEVYYSGNKIHETTLGKGETTNFNGTAANGRPYVQRLENPFLNATNEIVYYYKATAPVENDVTKPTKQTVTFEGAGDKTPTAKVQNDFTFTGKEKNGSTTWDRPSHIYGKETVPVVKGYYADKKEAGSKTVTPDQPEVTDKVIYKPLGKIIPVDETNTPIPSAPTPQYNNDSQDPTKGGVTPTPVIPGYVTDILNVTPSNPGVDTPVIYRKAEQKAVIKYIDTSANDKELTKDAVSGKSGEAINYSTDAKIADFVNKGYKLVEDGFKKATEGQKKFDSDASTDQVFVVKLEHDVTPVGPNNPHKPTDPINPNDPNSKKYPAEDQWKKDVRSTVKYVVSDGKATAPADNVQNAQWTRTLKLDKVTGEVLSSTPWAANKANYDAVPTPGLTGYYADKGSVASKTVTQENLEETVTYKPLGNLVPKPETPNDPNFPSTPEVKYPNNPTDPTKPGNPVVPNVPGYKPYLPDPNYPSKPGEPGRPVEPGKELPNLPTDPGGNTPIIYVPIANDVKKATKQTVTFEGAGTATPADKVQDNFTFTGKQQNGTTTWDQHSHTYGKETVPVVTGYYADKKEAGSKTVTPEQPEVTDKVTYKALGKIIQVDESGNVIPGSVSKIYENNPSNPTEAAETKIPDAPTGYKIKEEQPQAWGYNIVDKTIEPNDESDSDRISRDTPIIYVPIVNDVTKPTKQTVTFEGAGTATPADKVQDNFTFTGKQRQVDGNTTWDQPNHTYGKETVPVVTGYYADKKEAGSKTVTPDQPEVTDKVTYKPLGKIIPVDPEGNPIPKAPTPQYNNDSEDPTKGGKTPTPVIPGYVTDTPSVTPNKPGEDTPVVYRKAEQKAIINYVDQNTGTTLENDQLSGKSGEAIDYSTTAKIQKYQDRGYVLVSDEFPAGATYDTDASRDQIWTVTLKHGETPVGPNDPHNPTDPINPNDPNSPRYPAENQWKKDVTSTVHYVVSDGNATAPADNVQNAQWTRTLKLDKVTGEVLNPTELWTANKANYDVVPTPGLTGYYADKGSVASKTVTQENLEETVTYRPLGKLVPKPETPNDPNFPSTPDVKYPNDPTDPTKPGQPVVPDVPGYKPYLPDPNDPTKPDKDKPVEPGKELPNLPTNPGDDTPIIYVPIVNDVTKPTKQTVKFEGAGDKTPADNVQDDFTFTGKENKADGTTTWNEKNHTYGKVSVPVIPGYYADKSEAGGKTVTPENPEAIDTVTYKPLGSLVPKSDDPKFPSTPDVKYPNDPTDPGKPGKPIVPDVPGYNPYLPDPKDPSKPGQPVEPGKELPNLPTNPGDDTPIIYVPIVNDVKKPTKQTVKFEGAGDKTPADNVQDDFTFTGKENKASGTTTWTEKSHTYGKVSVPVIPGYYADKTEAGGKTVTPENPEATDTVTYKPLGKLVPKPERPNDPNFPSTPEVKYPNDPTDPGKPGKPVVPDVPGYKPYLPDPKDPSKPGKPVEPGKPITPENPGDDTPIIYVPVKPDTPVVPNPEPQTPAKPDPKPLDPEKVVQELPNTGTDSNTVMTGLGIIGMATTLLGLAQKKKDD
ncbi:mucin-binding protein [Streptococcus sp. KHUD_014]|uniref:mucin-binding protein n=1 Tax=Streptococcus sp. KHUD_014 TaxID=3434353 RepID=UPI003DA5FFAE